HEFLALAALAVAAVCRSAANPDHVDEPSLGMRFAFSKFRATAALRRRPSARAAWVLSPGGSPKVEARHPVAPRLDACRRLSDAGPGTTGSTEPNADASIGDCRRGKLRQLAASGPRVLQDARSRADQWPLARADRRLPARGHPGGGGLR